MRFTNDNPPAKNTMIKIVSQLSDPVGEINEIDVTEDDNFYMLAMVDFTKSDPKKSYNAKAKSIKAGKEGTCPMNFLADGISDDYIQLMRGLQFLEPIDADTLIGLANTVKQSELWVRSSINTHTPLEAAISAGFTEFGSETADEIAKVLVARGAPLIRYSIFPHRLGGPTSSPIHMLMSFGQFARLNDLLLAAHAVGRINGDEEPHAADLIWNDNQEGSPMWHCRHSALEIKFLQSDLCRHTLDKICPPEEVLTYRSGSASRTLRAAALGIIARDAEDFAGIFEELSAFEPQAMFAGRAIHRCVEGRAEALPIAHLKKLLDMVPEDVALAYDSCGRTVLHWAGCAGNDKAVKALVEKYPQLVGMPTKPWANDAHPFYDEIEPLLKKKEYPFKFSNVTGKLPIQFATENHNLKVGDNEKLEAMTQAIAFVQLNVDVLGQNTGTKDPLTKEDLRDILDGCLANLASRKASSTTVNAVLSLYAKYAPGYPRRGVASAVLRRNTNFLTTVYNFTGKLPMNIILDTTETYHVAIDDKVKKWGRDSSPSRTKHANGLRMLVLNNNNQDQIEKDEKDGHYIKKYSGDRVLTPVLLACNNGFDLDMVQFLVNQCGCTTDASFIAEKFNSGELLINEGTSEKAENKGNLAKRCMPYYVATVLLHSRETFAADEERARAFNLIKFLIESCTPAKPMLLTQNIDMKKMIFSMFLSSNLVNDQNAATFFRFLNFDFNTQIPREFQLSPSTLFHLINYTSFSRWDLLPKALFSQFLKYHNLACNCFEADKKDDEDEEDDAPPANRSRFVAFNPGAAEEENDSPESFDYFDGNVHILLRKIYPAAAGGQTNHPSEIRNGFNALPYKNLGLFAFNKNSALNTEAVLSRRTSFCKFLVDTFWTAESSLSERSVIFFFCHNTQTAIRSCAKTASSFASQDLPFNYLMDRMESSGVTEVPFDASTANYSTRICFEPPFFESDVDSAVRYLKLFGSNFTRSSGFTSTFMLKKSCFSRFVLHAEFVSTFLSVFSAQIDGSDSKFSNYAEELVLIAINGHGVQGRDYSHIFDNETLISGFKSGLTPQTRLAAVNEKFLTAYLGGQSIHDPFKSMCVDNPSMKHALFSIASSASGIWFDKWCANQLRNFFCSDGVSSMDIDGWYVLQNFLSVIANSSRATIVGDTEINPVFDFFITEGIDLLNEDINVARGFAVVLRAVLGSCLPKTIRALAEYKQQTMTKLVQTEDIDQLLEEELSEFAKHFAAPSSGGGDDDEEEEERDEEPITFSWDLGSSLILRFGGADMLASLRGISKNMRGSYYTRNFTDNVVDAFVSTWGDRLAQGEPLDMKHVNLFFSRTSFTIQGQLISHLIKGGRFINEDVFENEGKALATFIFECLTKNCRVHCQKTVVDVLDLGTRNSSDPSEFISAYEEEVDTALRDECAVGNPVAFEVVKRCADALRKNEQFQQNGPYKVHDNVFLYDADIDQNSSGMFAQLYSELNNKSEEEEEEEKKQKEAAYDEFGTESSDTSTPFSAMEPDAFARLVYMTRKGVPPSDQTPMSPKEADSFYQAYFKHSVAVNVDLAPAVATNSTLQKLTVAARSSIPRYVNILLEFKEDASGMRVDVSTSSRSDSWAHIRYDEDESLFIVELNPSALAADVVPENVTLDDKLENFLADFNTPKLFNPDL